MEASVFFLQGQKTLNMKPGQPVLALSPNSQVFGAISNLVMLRLEIAQDLQHLKWTVLHWAIEAGSTGIWAAAKNQQKACAPSEDSDQPGHLPSLISVFTVCSVGS